MKYRYSAHKESMYVVCLVSKVKGILVDKSNVSIFFEFTELFVLSLLFRPRKFQQTSFTVARGWRKLEFTCMIPGHAFDMKGSGNNFYYR